MNPEKEKTLARVLLQKNIITQEQLSQILEISKKKTMSLPSVLVSGRYIDSHTLSSILKLMNTSDTNPDFLNISSSNISNTFGRYSVEKEIGRGGMGAVYLVNDPQLNRRVALKVILAHENISENQIQRFLQEARSMAQIKHPNVLEVYEIGTQPRNYFTMEYIEGKTLAEWSENNFLPKKIALIFAASAKALAEVHRHGIIHRDIKPSNIMVTIQGQPKLMDFGLAKLEDSQLSQSGELLGTPAYMSPEQAHGNKIDTTSDIYSLGASLYEVLTGNPPFRGSSFANLVYQIVNTDPTAPLVLNPEIPVDLEAICLKCLEKNPKKRYQTAKALAKDLENFSHNKPVIAKPTTKFTYAKKWLVRNKTLVTISLCSGIAILLSLIMVIISLQQQAQIQKQAAIKFKESEQKARSAEKKAKLAEKNAIKERDKAIFANKLLVKAKKELSYENYKTKRVLYSANILLAEKYSKESQTQNADNILNSEELCPLQMRDWEWKWLKNLLHKEAFSYAEKARVLDCTFSDDGKTIISVGDLFIRVRDFKTKKIITNIPTDRVIISCSVYKDKLATLDYGGLLQIWNYKTGKLLKFFSHHNQGTRCVFYSSKYVLCSYKVKDNPRQEKEYESLLLWDIQKGQKKLALKAHKARFYNDVNYCDASPDGKYFITAGEDKTLRLYTKKGKQLRIFKGHKSSVNSCHFSSDSKMIVSASNDKTLIIWNLLGKRLKVLQGHSSEVFRGYFLPDNISIISVGADNRIVLWDIKSRKQKKFFTGHGSMITNCAISSNGKYMISGSYDETLKLWKLFWDNPLTLPKQANYVRSLTINKDNILASIYHSSFFVQLWDLRTAKKVKRLFFNFPLRFCAFSPDGEKIIAGSAAGTMEIREVTSGKLLYDFHRQKDSVRCFDFNPQSTMLVSSGDSRKIYLWDLKKPGKMIAPKAVLKGHKEKVMSCFFSIDGKKIVSAGENAMKVWSVEQKKLLLTVPNIVYAVCHPNGKYIAGGGLDGKIHLYDIVSAKKIATFKGHSRFIQFMIFTKNGKRIITCGNDKLIKIWNTEIYDSQIVASPILTLDGHYPVHVLALNNDNSILVSGGEDRLIRVWQAK